jgi:predicted DNA-binding transcriptional regulator YafY
MNLKKYLSETYTGLLICHMVRASHIQKAKRPNLARTLLQRYPHWPEAAQRLARNCSISERQAYRYLEQAQRRRHPVPVGDVKVSFTVKLSRRLVERLRTYAASTGLTLSEIASRAFSAVLHRGGGRG